MKLIKVDDTRCDGTITSSIYITRDTFVANGKVPPRYAHGKMALKRMAHGMAVPVRSRCTVAHDSLSRSQSRTTDS